MSTTASPTSVTTSMSFFMKNILKEKTVDLLPSIALKIDIVKDNALGHPAPKTSLNSNLVKMTSSLSDKEVNRWNPMRAKNHRSSQPSSIRVAASDSMLLKMPKRLQSPSSSQKRLNASWKDSNLPKFSTKAFDYLLGNDIFSLESDIAKQQSTNISTTTCTTSRRRRSSSSSSSSLNIKTLRVGHRS